VTDDFAPQKRLIYSFYPPRDEFTVTMARRDICAEIAIRITNDSIVFSSLKESGFTLANKSHKRIPKKLKGWLYRISIPGAYNYDEVSRYFVDSLAAIGADHIDLVAGDYHYFNVTSRKEEGILVDTESKIPCIFFRFPGPFEVMRYRFKIVAAAIPWNNGRIIDLNYFPEKTYYFFGRPGWDNTYEINTIASTLDYGCQMFENSQTGMFHVMLTTRGKYKIPGMRLYLTCYETPEGMIIQPEIQKSSTVYGDDYKYDSVCLVKQTSFFPPADSFNVYITEYGDTGKFTVKYFDDSINITPLNETLLSCQFLAHERLNTNLSWLVICPVNNRAKDSLEIFTDKLMEFFDQNNIKTEIVAEGFYPVSLFDSIPSIRHIMAGPKTNLVWYRIDYEIFNPIIFLESPENADEFIAALDEFRSKWKYMDYAVAWYHVGHKVLKM